MPWLLLCYPLVVHAAVLSGAAWLQWLALTLLGGMLLMPLLTRSRALFAALLLLWVAAIALLPSQAAGRYFLMAAPVLISLSIFLLFATSLLPGRQALVTRIATAMRGPLPPAVRCYTRQVTLFWAALLALWTLANLLLALLAPAWLWSLFANLLNYLILGGVFVGEWLFRCWYLGNEETLTWQQYFRKLATLDYRRL